MNLKIFQTIEGINDFAARKFIENGNRSIDRNGRFSVALAGGSTPKQLYQLLTTDGYKNLIEWSKCFFFFGDERNVSPNDENSNFRMADENLFQPLRINPENIFRWLTELGDEKKIAGDYERQIQTFFNITENEFPAFDLILLGMGSDGHTASLFPFTGALKERRKTAVANRVEKLDTWRYTLTFPAINNAGEIIFLVKGEEKAETLKEIFEGESQPQRLPSQNIKPGKGNLFWLVDYSAAKFLTREKNSLEVFTGKF